MGEFVADQGLECRAVVAYLEVGQFMKDHESDKFIGQNSEPGVQRDLALGTTASPFALHFPEIYPRRLHTENSGIAFAQIIY